MTGRGQSLTDALCRALYRMAFAGLRVSWWLLRPQTEGALVALWHEGELLLVRNSYRQGWALPGGGIRRGESAAAAACRELREEVGVALDPGRLALCCVLDGPFEHRRDRLHVFEARIGERPSLTIDRREIVAARFFDAASALPTDALANVRRYLQQRGGTG
jgi:8-oxo-dGTP pyrophosphatase MutT (NUDIX family)